MPELADVLTCANRWFASRIGRIKEIKFGAFKGPRLRRHDMHPSAVSALVALLHASLERIVVINEPSMHGETRVRTSDPRPDPAPARKTHPRA